MSIFYDSDRWTKARRAALARDDSRCQDCGSTEDLHVHHIRPVRSFQNPEDAHYVDNLVTLCKYCHPEWEGIDERPILAGLGGVRLEEVIRSITLDTLVRLTMVSDTSSIYERYILSNPGICSNCHCKIRTYAPSPKLKNREYISSVLWDDGEIRGLGVEGHKDDTKEGLTSCGWCQECSSTASPGERTKRTLCIHGHTLRNRLLEMGFGISHEFYETLHGLKSDPARTHDDRGILSDSVQAGVESAWESRGHPWEEDEVEKG